MPGHTRGTRYDCGEEREVRRDPRVSLVVAAVCVAMIIWALALQSAGGYATRYPAVPISLATFLAIQLLVPRTRWNRDRVLGPGNVAVSSSPFSS